MSDHLEMILWMFVLGVIGLDYYQYRKQAKEERAILDDIYDRMTKPRVNIPIGRTTWNIKCECVDWTRACCPIHGPDGQEVYDLL